MSKLNIQKLLEQNDLGLLHLIASKIEQYEEEDKREPSTYFKPSSMNCERQMYYIARGEEQDRPPTDSALVGICESGTDRHERLQAVFKRISDEGRSDLVFVDPEEYAKENGLTHLRVRSRNKYEVHFIWEEKHLSFLCDGIIKYRGKYYVLEIKTETQQKFFKRDDIAEVHKSQICCYSAAFGIGDAVFLYENRNNCQKKVFMTKIKDKDIQKHVYDKIDYVKDCLEIEQVPEKPTPDIRTRLNLCMYCPYVKKCNGDCMKKWRSGAGKHKVVEEDL